MALPYSAIRPLLFALDPETAHNLVIGVIQYRWIVRGLAAEAPAADERLHQTLFGLSFDNPIGLAAGLDKQGTAVAAWERLGFGSAEIGTVTPRPQPGNPRPRLFRLPQDGALINRFGFNSAGAPGVAANLRRGGGSRRMRVGINIGRNKDTPNDRAIDDYLTALEPLAEFADYVAINVSSPNTTGLRDLQESRHLADLVRAVVEQAHASGGRSIPVLVKLSPDMEPARLLESADAAVSAGAAGLIATNTTVSRDGLTSPGYLTREAGGLSGQPLRARANAACRALYSYFKGQIPIVGVGGIDSVESAYERFRSGASLVQIYTGLIYRGPTLAHDIARGLSERLSSEGRTQLKEVIGLDAN